MILSVFSNAFYEDQNNFLSSGLEIIWKQIKEREASQLNFSEVFFLVLLILMPFVLFVVFALIYAKATISNKLLSIF